MIDELRRSDTDPWIGQLAHRFLRGLAEGKGPNLRVRAMREALDQTIRLKVSDDECKKLAMKIAIQRMGLPQTEKTDRKILKLARELRFLHTRIVLGMPMFLEDAKVYLPGFAMGEAWTCARCQKSKTGTALLGAEGARWCRACFAKARLTTPDTSQFRTPETCTLHGTFEGQPVKGVYRATCPKCEPKTCPECGQERSKT